MKTFILTGFFLIYFFTIGFSQNEYFVHCFGNDTILIDKISESSSGDTLIKTFHDYTFDFDGAVNTDFNLYFFNDSVFSKFGDTYYIIGDNNAQVGDVWHPLRYYNYSYVDTTEICSILMDLEVTSIEQVLINGTPTNYFHLKDLQVDNGLPSDYSFLSNIGATQGGPFYNLAPIMSCDMIAEIPGVFFKSYTIDNDTYLEYECPFIDDVSLSENNLETPTIENIGNTIVVKNVENIMELSIYNLTGQKLMKTTESELNVSNLHGIYIVKLLYSGGQETVKFYFD